MRKNVLCFDISTFPTLELETNRIVIFCGATLYRPHRAVRQQLSKIHSDIYIADRMRGSPAHMYDLAPTSFIMAVNGVPTPNLEFFLRETKKIEDKTYFRLKIMTSDNVSCVRTLKANNQWFPTEEFIRNADLKEGWRRLQHESGVKEEKGEAVAGQEKVDAGRDAMEGRM